MGRVRELYGLNGSWDRGSRVALIGKVCDSLVNVHGLSLDQENEVLGSAGATGIDAEPHRNQQPFVAPDEVGP
jgi:hypothetical protein